MIFNAGLKYHPDAVLVCIYANDIVNINLNSTTEMMFQTALRPTGKIYRAAYLFWPYSFAAAKSYHDFKQKISASKTSNFIKTITEPAKAQGVPQQDIERWRAGLPRDLVQAVNRGELNGNGLAYGLLYPAYWSDAIDLQSQTIKEKAQKMLEFMVKIVKTCQARSIAVAVVYIPSPFQYDPAALDPGVRNPWRESGVFMDKRWLTEKTAAQRLFEEYAKITGVPFLDLTPALRQAAQSQKGITYPLDGHWTPSGHKLAEEAIARWIRENRVFPIQ
jgi:lysophospholipase L1-like esterase